MELLALLAGAEAPAFETAAAPLPAGAPAPGASPIARWALATARKGLKLFQLFELTFLFGSLFLQAMRDIFIKFPESGRFQLLKI